LAKEIAAIVAPRGLWWEPFCGGLSVSVQLAKYGPGIVSDVNPALIALCQAVRDGWAPPHEVSREQYEAARLLPDSDPLKAFAGFGCSFGGKWFDGYAYGGKNGWYAKPGNTYASAAARSVVRDVAALSACELLRTSFFDVLPGSLDLDVIYCDPPYAGTTGYAGAGAFDHSAFWQRCHEWAETGARVYVSEYGCTVSSAIEWEKAHRTHVSRAGDRRATVERVYRINPLLLRSHTAGKATASASLVAA
jgi:DNA adenine methylase